VPVVILGDASQPADARALGVRSTLDDFFRRAALRRPDAVALRDPPNRESFTQGPPRQLTYAEADRMISAVADRLHRLGLPIDSIIAVQLPNTVESILTLLGLLRAGMIAAPLPLLWRRGEIVDALSRIGAKMLITCGRFGADDYADLARNAAAEIFSIRYVCAFGSGLPDGVVPLDDLYLAENLGPLPRMQRDGVGNAAAHLALITWDVASGGLVPLARNHRELIAAGRATFLEGRFEQNAALLSALAPSSFAGIALTLLPWLLTGGTLNLHQPFDLDGFAAECRERRCDTILLPGPVAARLSEAGYFATAGDLKNVVALWRSPEQMTASPAWREKTVALIDVAAFGETAVIPARRGIHGEPASIPIGAVTAPRGAAGATLIAELMRTEAGTVAVRGPMVPRQAFPPGAERGSAAHLNVLDGIVDTSFPCRPDRDAETIVVTGPPPGIAAVGGYRFALGELEQLVAGLPGGAHIAAITDALTGQRLSGFAIDPAAARAALAERGVNPLVLGAFTDSA
jgi:hypothetical protein